MQVINNFHTHTHLCHHAEGDVKDYLRVASKSGCTAMGISDHMPCPDGRWPQNRMQLSDLPHYQKQCDVARAAYPNIRLLKGLECEYIKEYHSFYTEILREREACEYLIGAVHYYPMGDEWRNSFYDVTTKEDLHAFTRYMLLTMESGLYDFIAHPDNFGYCYHMWDAEAIACSKDIFEMAVALGLPLEINSSGLRKKKVPDISDDLPLRFGYPMDRFWELGSDYPIKVLYNSDAHKPQELLAGCDELHAFIKKHALTCIPSFEQYLSQKHRS